MVRKTEGVDRIYMDEAEGFLLEHALFSPTRTWRPAMPPSPPHPSSSTDRLAATRKRMDWEGEVANHPPDPMEDLLYSRKPKIAKLSHQKGAGEIGSSHSDEDTNSERCVICLMALRDRTIVGVCGHEFCFECIGVWANQSRRCPLCSADMAPFLLHDLDNPTPTKFYLPPLPTRNLPTLTLPGPSRRRPSVNRQTAIEKLEKDELDEQVARRRDIYEHELYVKHIASNPITKFKPNPTPRQIADDPVLIQRATIFMRRELRVWSLVDVEFLTTYILSLLKAIDIRSDPAIRLLAEFLDSPTGPGYPHGAEHFAHEIYSFLRSPFKDLARWDAVAQYDPLPGERIRSLSPAIQEVVPEAETSTSKAPGMAPVSDRSRSVSRSLSLSTSPSLYSRSPPRPRSRSPPPRDWKHRDVFIPPGSPGARRWDEADSWIDPEYQAWLDKRRLQAQERAARRNAKRYRRSPEAVERMEEREELPEPKEQVELLPSPPPAVPLRMEELDDEDVLDLDEDELMEEAEASGFSIKGAAIADLSTRKALLLEKLAKAKAEANDKITLEHQLQLQRQESREHLRARLRLRLKLESERASLKYNINESKAQELRRLLLEAKERRASKETDATLKTMDRLERAAEVRRRLMVMKMMAAETEGERKQRELKEKLVAERRRKLLKDLLLKRKSESQGMMVEGNLSVAVASY